MAARKRTSKRSGLVGRAVSEARKALREAEKRIPPDLRRQVERRIKDADKTARAAITQLQSQAKRATTRADVNSVLKRIDGLTKQARLVARGTGPRAASTRRRAATTTRRAVSRTRKATSTARRKVAAAKPAARRAATTTRRSTTASRPRASSRRTRATETSPPEMPMGGIETGESS